MSGNHSRRKGGNFERELVNYMREAGLNAKRVPLSGMTDFHKGDVTIAPGYAPEKPLCGELKRKAKLPVIFNEIEGFDFLAVREDRGETLIVIRASLFRDLLQ